MKKQLLIISLYGIVLLFTDCAKGTDPQPEYVPGEVIIRFYDNVSFKSAYLLVDSLDLGISYLKGFGYYVDANQVSIDTIKEIIRTKPYLTNGGEISNATLIDSIIKISTRFFDLDIVDAIDWFATVEQLMLKDDFTDKSFNWGVLIVPIGQEQYWIDQLNQYNIVKYAELNGIGYIS